MKNKVLSFTILLMIAALFVFPNAYGAEPKKYPWGNDDFGEIGTRIASVLATEIKLPSMGANEGGMFPLISIFGIFLLITVLGMTVFERIPPFKTKSGINEQGKKYAKVTAFIMALMVITSTNIMNYLFTMLSFITDVGFFILWIGLFILLGFAFYFMFIKSYGAATWGYGQISAKRNKFIDDRRLNTEATAQGLQDYIERKGEKKAKKLIKEDFSQTNTVINLLEKIRSILPDQAAIRTPQGQDLIRVIGQKLITALNIVKREKIEESRIKKIEERMKEADKEIEKHAETSTKLINQLENIINTEKDERKKAQENNLLAEIQRAERTLRNHAALRKNYSNQIENMDSRLRGYDNNFIGLAEGVKTALESGNTAEAGRYIAEMIEMEQNKKQLLERMQEYEQYLRRVDTLSHRYETTVFKEARELLKLK